MLTTVPKIGLLSLVFFILIELQPCDLYITYNQILFIYVFRFRVFKQPIQANKNGPFVVMYMADNMEGALS